MSTEQEAILEDLALIVSRIDAVAHESTPPEYREDVRLQARELLRLASSMM